MYDQAASRIDWARHSLFQVWNPDYGTARFAQKFEPLNMNARWWFWQLMLMALPGNFIWWYCEWYGKPAYLDFEHRRRRSELQELVDMGYLTEEDAEEEFQQWAAALLQGQTFSSKMKQMGSELYWWITTGNPVSPVVEEEEDAAQVESPETSEPDTKAGEDGSSPESGTDDAAPQSLEALLQKVEELEKRLEKNEFQRQKRAEYERKKQKQSGINNRNNDRKRRELLESVEGRRTEQQKKSHDEEEGPDQGNIDSMQRVVIEAKDFNVPQAMWEMIRYYSNQQLEAIKDTLRGTTTERKEDATEATDSTTKSDREPGSTNNKSSGEQLQELSSFFPSLNQKIHNKAQVIHKTEEKEYTSPVHKEETTVQRDSDASHFQTHAASRSLNQKIRDKANAMHKTSEDEYVHTNRQSSQQQGNVSATPPDRFATHAASRSLNQKIHDKANAMHKTSEDEYVHTDRPSSQQPGDVSMPSKPPRRFATHAPSRSLNQKIHDKAHIMHKTQDHEFSRKDEKEESKLADDETKLGWFFGWGRKPSPEKKETAPIQRPPLEKQENASSEAQSRPQPTLTKTPPQSDSPAMTASNDEPNKTPKNKPWWKVW